MIPQIIQQNDKTKLAVLAYEDFLILKEKAEMLEDIQAYDEAKNDETFPFEVADRIIEGENPIKIFREYRNLTQKQLAEEVGITEQYISRLENGNRQGTVKQLKKIAEILKVDLGNLV